MEEETSLRPNSDWDHLRNENRKNRLSGIHINNQLIQSLYTSSIPPNGITVTGPTGNTGATGATGHLADQEDKD